MPTHSPSVEARPNVPAPARTSADSQVDLNRIRESFERWQAELVSEAIGEIEELLVRTATGSKEAFSTLYDLMAPRVLGLIRRVLVDQAQSEEVAQEVLLEIWQTAASYSPSKGKATTWMLTVAHRRAIDRVRASQASKDRDLKIGVRDFEGERDDVAESAEISIEHKRAQQALAKLSDQQREAVTLAYYGGLTQSEIAERLEVPLGTVKTRIRDGMNRLRRELGVES
ncbi:sigma-70 family RNA polymerase sigma factor [Pseudoclavibacter terrae]|uniref:Sigma-70 family RNA polymerase sigma factor n=1 Tax=Pseudoclavibacter terrae TaxID=1530195 RepID=A0A7J5B015_9MICO|nr:sigma-70 family RNA polymerase sigma factor [Pseudoclavibacter terrae]